MRRERRSVGGKLFAGEPFMLYKTKQGFAGRVEGFSCDLSLETRNVSDLKIGSIVDRVRKIFPRFLTMRALMVGCAAGTGDLAACDEKDEAWVASSLQASLSCYTRQNKASLVVLKDFPATYRSKLEMFQI